MKIKKLQINMELNSFLVNGQSKINYFEKYSSRIIHSYIYSSLFYVFLTQLKDNQEKVLANIKNYSEQLYKDIIQDDKFINDFEDKLIGYNFNYYLEERDGKKTNSKFWSLSVYVSSSSKILIDILEYLVCKVSQNEETKIIDGSFNVGEKVEYKLTQLFHKNVSFDFELCDDNNFELKVRNFNYHFDKNTDLNSSFYYNEKSIAGIKTYLCDILNINEEQIVFDKVGFMKKIKYLQSKNYDLQTKTIIFGDKLVNLCVVDFNCVIKNLNKEQEKKLEYYLNEGFGNKNSFGFGTADLANLKNLLKYGHTPKRLNDLNQRKNKIAALLAK